MLLGTNRMILAQESSMAHAFILTKTIFSTTPEQSYNRELWRRFELSHFSSD